jgi:hypothetical protein
MKFRISLALILSAVLLLGSAGIIWAGSKTTIVVKTVLASQGSRYIDPRLAKLVQEFDSVFRYSSYRLLGQSSMTLVIGKTGAVRLPGDRVLRITPMKISGNRVKLGLTIHKKRQQIFKTVVQLLNRGNMTLGGPKHEGGYLLFNIYCSF